LPDLRASPFDQLDPYHPGTTAMTSTPRAATPPVLPYGRPVPPAAPRGLLAVVLALALPSLFEQVFNFLVGLNDTFLANRLPRDVAPAATAAVGTVSYLLWFIGLIVSAIGTGSTALISRAKGARHRRLANSVCGQSVMAALIVGLALAGALFLFAEPCVRLTRLPDVARGFALSYLRMLAACIPFMTVMLVGSACLRGAGDTLTPAVVIILVNIVNMALSWGLTYGLFGLPRMGFDGIALGTVIAYVVGGVLLALALLSGRGGVRLHAHRLRPHWLTIRRVLRIGVPAGFEWLLTWVAQFAIVIAINQMDKTAVAAAAHLNAVKIEAFSYLPGLAFATAAATVMGESLGMRDPRRARHGTYLALALGGGIMTLCGVAFILFGRNMAGWMLPDQPEIADLTARCLFVTGWIQSGFAASMILSGALRGAGDTVAVMGINLVSLLALRLVPAMLVIVVFHAGLVAVWVVLAAELFVRGTLIFVRFQQGAWRHKEV
jgi:putative MATE family efflux protein